MSRHAGSTPAADTDTDDDVFDPNELRSALAGDGSEESDDERTAREEADAALTDDLAAELARGLDDEDDLGGDEEMTDEELVEALHPDEGDEVGITDDEGEGEAGAGEPEGGGGEATPEGDPAEASQPPAQDAQVTAAAWEALSVGADKETITIDEAVVQRVNGHVMIAVPEGQFDRFKARLGRGVVAEKVWRHLDAADKEVKAERQKLEQERAAWGQESQRKTEAEIEAEETLRILKEGDLLKSMLDARDLDLLDARIAARVAAEGVRKPVAAAAAAAPAAEAPTPAAAAPVVAEEEAPALVDPAALEQEEVHLLAVDMLTIIAEHPDPAIRAQLATIPEAEQRAVFNEMNAERKKYAWRQSDGLYTNRDAIFEKLMARVPKAPTPDTTTAGGTPPASTATGTTPVASADAPRQPAATADRAEAFNRGVNSAARPTTTSVKARRTVATARPAHAGATRDAGARPRARTEQEIQAEADEEWENTKRSYLRSGSLDLED